MGRFHCRRNICWWSCLYLRIFHGRFAYHGHARFVQILLDALLLLLAVGKFEAQFLRFLLLFLELLLEELRLLGLRSQSGCQAVDLLSVWLTTAEVCSQAGQTRFHCICCCEALGFLEFELHLFHPMDVCLDLAQREIFPLRVYGSRFVVEIHGTLRCLGVLPRISLSLSLFAVLRCRRAAAEGGGVARRGLHAAALSAIQSRYPIRLLHVGMSICALSCLFLHLAGASSVTQDGVVSAVHVAAPRSLVPNKAYNKAA